MAAKTPIRTCVVCRRADAKSALLRIVRTPDGRVLVDSTGKMPGRGAYVCQSAECLRAAGLNRRLNRALKTGLDDNTLNDLAIEFDRLSTQKTPHITEASYVPDGFREDESAQNSFCVPDKREQD